MSYSLFSVSKSFTNNGNKIQVLSNVSLTLPDKGFVLITGKSGSGKTTLLNLLSGIEKPTSGVINYNDQNITQLNDKEFSNYCLNEISFVYQHYNLFDDLTVIDNLLIPLQMKGFKNNESIKIIEDKLDLFGLKRLSNKKASQLSGGEKQRVCLIRALLKKPKVLFCDEPTGALDNSNSKEILKILKDISKEILVVVVSHDVSLFLKESDSVYLVENCEVIEKKKMKDNFTIRFNEKRNKYNSKWGNKFIKHYLKKNVLKNTLILLSCIFGFICCYVSIGYIKGSNDSNKYAILNNYEIECATISKKEYLHIDNSNFTLERSTKPSVEDIDNTDGLSEFIIQSSFDYLFTKTPYCTFNKEYISGFTMVPLYNLNVSNFNNVFVNKEFMNLLNDDDLIFNISNEVNLNIDLDGKIIKETFSYSLNLEIVNVLEEFSFLNTPKIYYSYPLLVDFLKSKKMVELSKEWGSDISYFKYFSSLGNTDKYGDYYSYIFPDKSNFDKFESVANKLNENKDGIKIESTPIQIKDTYITLTNSISSFLYVFLAMIFILINIIIGFYSYSNFIIYKKDAAILTCLGGRFTTIKNIFSSMSLVVVFAGVFVSTFLSIPVINLLNKIISNNFGLNNIISLPFFTLFGLKNIVPFLVLFLSLFFALVFSNIPITYYRRFSISNELKDE